MKKKLVVGALALSATAVLGLTGCGNDGKKADEPVKYTVTFDHDNNADTPNVVVKYTEGQTVLDSKLIPAVPESAEGFAGVWDTITLNDEDIVVTAKYGDGTSQNPYLVATEAQFKKIITEYTALQSVHYLGSTGSEIADEAQALTKEVRYKTITLVYTRATTSDSWGKVSSYIFGDTKTYFKLATDINLYNLDLASINLAGRYFSGEIDGQGHTISGFNGAIFPSTYGAMFDNVVGTRFKNMTINMESNLATLAMHARGGYNAFENVTINQAGNMPIRVHADDTNESPFIAHALGNTTELTFKNCTNNANLVSEADYFGIFLGGYAKDVLKLNFRTCVNNGTIKSSGSVGILTGNGTYSPARLEVNDECKNNGVVETAKESHMLVSHATGNGSIASKIATYDTNEYGYDKFTTLSTKHEAAINGTDITVSKKASEQEDNITKGTYQLILSGYASNSSAKEGHLSLYTNIVISLPVDQDVESLKFEDVYYGMMDLNTYNSQSFAEKIDSSTLGESDWIEMEGYRVRYFVDEVNGLYVVDFSQYETDAGLTENRMKLNISANNLKKVIVLYSTDAEGKVADIDFVVDFE